MTNKLDITHVNKFEEDWSVESQFNEWNVKAVLKKHSDWIAKINAVSQIRKKLMIELGEDGKEWMIVENINTNEDELYLKNSSTLIMWKLQDSNQFGELFDRIEQHRITITNEISKSSKQDS